MDLQHIVHVLAHTTISTWVFSRQQWHLVGLFVLAWKQKHPASSVQLSSMSCGVGSLLLDSSVPVCVCVPVTGQVRWLLYGDSHRWDDWSVSIHGHSVACLSSIWHFIYSIEWCAHNDELVSRGSQTWVTRPCIMHTTSRCHAQLLKPTLSIVQLDFFFQC